MKLERGSRYGYKCWSVRFMGLALVAETAQQLVPVWSEFMPDRVENLITASLVTLAIVARFIHQELPDD